MTAPPMLEVRGLTCRFGQLAALDGLDLTIARGETRCVIGPNGAGKTTFLNVVCGLISLAAGSVTFDGRETTTLAPKAIANLGLLRSFQTPAVFSGLSVAINMEMSSRRPGASPTAASARVARLLEDVGLAAHRNTQAGNLSHGDKKRLELAMLLAAEPRMLLLDEPTAGMSIHETDEVVELLRRLCSDMTVVVIEHDMSFVRQIADRVSVFHRGALLAEGSVDEIKTDERVQELYLGTEIN
jgi:urea transport system ATP-binding protein